MNRDLFFTYVRQHLFGARLVSSQIRGLTAILDEWQANHRGKNDRWLAYMLGTVHHETDRRFQGIEEYGSASYFKKYNDRKDLGNGPYDGARFKGRGFVQLTGRRNYALYSTVLGVDLIKKPELALDLDNCVRILFDGMINGRFTGKKLADYFNASTDDWVNARRIINKLDKPRRGLRTVLLRRA